MEFLIKLGFFLLLISIGYWRGRRNEREHLQWLAQEEERLAHVLIFATRYPPPRATPQDPIMVTGTVVLASDHFRLFMGSLRKIVGGNFRAYETLMERGRRHALLRLKAAAHERGARMVFNVRFCTSRISDTRRAEATQVEVLAYGTIFVPATGAVSDSAAHYASDPTRSTLDDGPFDLFSNRVSRYWLITWLALVFYCFTEAIVSPQLEPQWVYVHGAPWTVFGLLAAVCGIGLLVLAARNKIPWTERIALVAISIPVLVVFQYFMALRLNDWTAPTPQPTVYILQKNMQLHPQDAPDKPVLDMAGASIEYWFEQKPGSSYTIPVAQGALGFAQYDTSVLRSAYRNFYDEQDSKRVTARRRQREP